MPAMLRAIQAPVRALYEEAPLLPFCGPALTIATINVWFDKHYQRERYDALFALLEMHAPDIVAFQEVTLDFIEQLKTCSWTAGYRWIDDHGAQLGNYGVGILSKLPMQNTSYAGLSSRMGRTVLWAEFTHQDTPFTVATTHLESMSENADYRKRQLKSIGDLLAKHPGGFFCGDFNLCASWPDENQALRNYEDLWSTLKPNDNGFTVDYSVNKMKPSTKAPVRFDRILSHGQHLWRPQTITMIATEPLEGRPNLWPSDHFGLLATMRLAG
mgnify:FL=1|tara:strand:+ start:85599 stop:86411 length:813 start_codon:yes stop_codon:yes gene_type:complete